jgi:hypothetical protein
MEPRTATPQDNISVEMPVTVLEFYDRALEFVRANYYDRLDYYRGLRFTDTTPDLFWNEYVWCVYAAGFSSKVLDKKWPALKAAYGDWRDLTAKRRKLVLAVIRREDKFKACLQVANMMQGAARGYAHNEWWLKFQIVMLGTPERLQMLPWIGPVSCYHLARNIGLDCVKPDLHLVRLAEHYGFCSPLRMCEYISVNRKDERLGVVDLVLFYACSTWGTLQIRRPGAR